MPAAVSICTVTRAAIGLRMKNTDGLSVPPRVDGGGLLKLAQLSLCTNKTSHLSHCHFY